MRASADEAVYPSSRRAVITLAILMLAYILSFLDRQILALMVDPIRRDLGINDFQISLLQGLAFALFFSVMGIPLGRLSDRLTRTHIIAIGIVWWSIMTALCGLAGGFAALFLFRMGVGLGEAALAPAAYSILGDSFPPNKLVRATSLFGQSATIGAGISLLAGGQLIDAIDRSGLSPFGLASWQLTFILVGLPGIIVAGLVLLIREPVRTNRSATPPGSFMTVLRSLWGERHILAPLYISGTLLAIINFGAVAWFPTHLIRHFGLTPGQAGLWLAPIHLAGGLLGAVLGSALTEWMLHREKSQPYLRSIAIVALLMAGTMIAPLLPTLGPALMIWSLSVVFQGAYAGSVMAAIQVTVPNERRGLATALLLLLSNLGALGLGSALIGGVSTMMFAGDPAGIGKGLALVGFLSAACSALIAFRRLAKG
ncbi:MAG: MFS transporter [Sphingobium sp.]